ncbi:MAG: acyl-CoA dehydrogenase [Myxococcota bacterium]
MDTIELAIARGRGSDRLGTAFLGGYTAAILALDPTLGPEERGALCATEAGGGHPRAIQTSLVDGRLSGTKYFVSGGASATVLLVVAKVGERDGRPELRVARVRSPSPGLTIEPGTPLDFIPEVPHGSVTFEQTPVDAVLEGDGYERYLKPFRTIEDLHVFGAVVGCLLANGKGIPHETQEGLLASLAAIQQLGRQSPSSAQTHLALAGVLRSARALIDTLQAAHFEAGFWARFERDRRLLDIAQKVREARRQKAWEVE